MNKFIEKSEAIKSTILGMMLGFLWGMAFGAWLAGGL